MLFVSGLVGVLFAPDTTGRDLEETQESSTRGSALPRSEQAEEPVSAGQRRALRRRVRTRSLPSQPLTFARTAADAYFISLRNWWTIVSCSFLGRCASPSSRSSISSLHSCVCSSR